MRILHSFPRLSLTAPLLLSLAISGCSDNDGLGISIGGDPDNVVSGVVQKGPMAGATVTVYRINTLGTRLGESVGDTADSNGYYEITLPWSGPSEVEAQGVYVDDITGAPVGNPVTLQAFTDVTGATVCNLNPFSHMVRARAAQMLTNGDVTTLGAALTSAEAAVIAGFGLSVNGNPVSLDLTDGAGPLATDNAILLLFSAALGKYATDNTLITNDLLVTLSDDIADDGLINGAGETLLGGVGTTASTIDLDTDIALVGTDLPNSTDLGGGSTTWVNHAPVALAASSSTNEDTASGSITLDGTDADGNALTVSVISGPANGSLNVSSGSAPLAVVYTPAADFNGNDSFSYVVNDGYVASATVVVPITVNAVNDAPVASAVTTVTTDEDTASAPISLTGTDAEGDTLSVSIASNPANGSLSYTGSAAPLAVTYTPSVDFNGSDSFQFRVLDGNGGQSAPLTVNLSVTAVNDAPVFGTVSNQSAVPGQAFSITVAATDADGDTLTYSSTGATLPSWATLNTVTGEISGTPDAIATTSGIEITADDNTTTTASSTFDLVVANNVSTIQNGWGHACAVVNGGVQCWGYNLYGQVGDNTTVDRYTPVNVVGLGSGATAVATGQYHSCAVVNGGVQCWGWNTSGQLGNNSTVNSSVPVQVTGLTSGVQAIAAGHYHTCALMISGDVKCWGVNSNGQLGNGTTTSSLVPVQVTGLTSGVTTITTQAYTPCAVVNGAAKCWGYNGYGNVGIGTITQTESVPVTVTGLTSGVTDIAAGNYNACAVVNGGVQCWGTNQYGRLGNGAVTDSSTPVQVTGLTSGVDAVALGTEHSCALSGSTIQCWGHNHVGQLGDGTNTDRWTPVTVTNLPSGVNGISAGYAGFVTCATFNTSVACWGNNQYGQLANNSTTPSYTPLEITTWSP